MRKRPQSALQRCISFSRQRLSDTPAFLQEQESLLAACSSQRELQWQVHIARAGQVVDASSGSSSFRVSMSDQLLQQLNFRSMGAYSVAWLNADVQAAEDKVDLLAHPETPRLIPAYRTISATSWALLSGQSVCHKSIMCNSNRYIQ